MKAYRGTFGGYKLVGVMARGCFCPYLVRIEGDDFHRLTMVEAEWLAEEVRPREFGQRVIYLGDVIFYCDGRRSA